MSRARWLVAVLYAGMLVVVALFGTPWVQYGGSIEGTYYFESLVRPPETEFIVYQLAWKQLVAELLFLTLTAGAVFFALGTSGPRADHLKKVLLTYAVGLVVMAGFLVPWAEVTLTSSNESDSVLTEVSGHERAGLLSRPEGSFEAPYDPSRPNTVTTVVTNWKLALGRLIFELAILTAVAGGLVFFGSRHTRFEALQTR